MSTAPKSWFGRMRQKLAKSSQKLTGGITGLFTKRKLDTASVEELEELLIQADLGVDMAMRITDRITSGRYDKGITPEQVQQILADEITTTLAPLARPLEIDPAQRPHVILVTGVNGSGKTTTIGKLAHWLRGQGKTVWLAAGDTFRAAAIDQLKIWAERTGSGIVAGAQGADAAGLAYDALQKAKAAGADVLLIDTAGRLQNQSGLMAELEKIGRVLKKVDPSAPHSVLLVLDATTGQNALHQAEVFGRTAGVTGLVMTKLDGTARGGILVAIGDKFDLPIHAIGIGEGADDLQPFKAEEFARAIAFGR